MKTNSTGEKERSATPSQKLSLSKLRFYRYWGKKMHLQQNFVLRTASMQIKIKLYEEFSKEVWSYPHRHLAKKMEMLLWRALWPQPPRAEALGRQQRSVQLLSLLKEMRVWSTSCGKAPFPYNLVSTTARSLGAPQVRTAALHRNIPQAQGDRIKRCN